MKIPNLSNQRFRALLLPVLGFGIALNLPAVLLSRSNESALPHGLFNLEFVILGAIGMYISRSLLAALLIAELLADCAFEVCYTYKFTLGQLLQCLQYVPLLPASRLVVAAALLVLSAAVCVLLSRMPRGIRDRRVALLTLGAVAAVALTVDTIDGQNFLLKRDSTRTQYRLVRSPALTLAVYEAEGIMRGEKVRTAQDVRTKSASSYLAELESSKETPVKPDIVFVLAESWGQEEDPGAAHGLIDSYDVADIHRKYTVKAGTVPFSGLTIPGEARELCESSMGFGVLQIRPEWAENCLPWRLRQMGYETTGVHGYIGQMFYRNSWYPKVGFESMKFRDDFRREGYQDCPGAFLGTCDSEVARWISQKLSNNADRPRFIYWVTLNAHLPVPVNPSISNEIGCAGLNGQSADPSLCSWYRLVKNVHQSVTDMALMVKRPTVFVVVGDHAPPFGNPALRRLFSPSEVPYVVLVPKPQPRTGRARRLHQPLMDISPALGQYVAPQ
jgi:phosphoglycerol transferase MdoB-like AlkP superfamily enzyme